MKKKLILKKFVMPTIYVMLVTLFVFSTFMSFANSEPTKEEIEDIKYVSDVWSNDTPVVSTEEKVLIKPYTFDKIVIGKYYYDYSDSADTQQNSIIYYENSYIQNSGVDYIYEKVFDVVAIYDGTVLKVEDNEITGKAIEIKHENNVISVYQGLSEIKVKEGDSVTQSTIIGKSGTSTINKSLGNHLHFEIYSNGKVLDPEECYNKKLEDL